ncbi:MAG: hypothetical protein WCP55_07595 [Lentisphaerota bacterium]
MKTHITKAILLLSLAVSAVSVYALPKNEAIGSGAEVKNSNISARTEGNFSAVGNSNVNAGVSGKNSYIKDSNMSSNVSGNVNAVNSKVNLGVKVDGAAIENSNISTNTNVGAVNAVNSNVSTGVELSGAKNSTIRTNVDVGTINAVNSNVNIGTVKGNADDKKVSTNVGIGAVDAVNKSVNIGNVNLGGGIGGNSRVFNEKESSGRGTNIGNVNVQSSAVKEVNVSVGDAGGDNVAEKIKARHMSKVYSDKAGVDASGTKHIFVSDKERKEAEKGGGDAGNVTIERGDHKTKKVDMFVDK